MTGMTGLDGEPYYGKVVHWVLSAPSYGKTTGDTPWRGFSDGRGRAYGVRLSSSAWIIEDKDLED